MTDAVTDTAADNILLRILLDPDARRDPYPLYRELRERAPVLRSSMGQLVLSRYDDCLEVLRDPRLGRGTRARLRGELPMPPMPAGFDMDVETARGFFDRAGNGFERQNTVGYPTRPPGAWNSGGVRRAQGCTTR